MSKEVKLRLPVPQICSKRTRSDEAPRILSIGMKAQLLKKKESQSRPNWTETMSAYQPSDSQLGQTVSLHVLRICWQKIYMRFSSPILRTDENGWSITQLSLANNKQVLCGFAGNFSGNCQETETCTVRKCYTPRQPLQNHPSGHLGGWAMPWSAEEKLDGQHQRTDIPVRVRTAYNGLLQKGLEENLWRIVCHVLSAIQSVNALN